jgi:hypothetical protein
MTFGVHGLEFRGKHSEVPAAFDEEQIIHHFDSHGERAYLDSERRLWWTIGFYLHQLARSMDARLQGQGGVPHY